MSENNIIKVMIKSVLWPIMLSVLSDRVASISGLGKLCGNMGGWSTKEELCLGRDSGTRQDAQSLWLCEMFPSM